MSLITYLGSGTGFIILLAVLLAVVIGSTALAAKKGHGPQAWQVAVGGFFASIGIVAIVLAENFPVPFFSENEAAIIPRLWASVLIPSSLFLIYRTLVGHEEKPESNGRLDKVALVTATLIISVYLMEYLGYFLCSGVFVLVSMYILGYRKVLHMIVISTSWVGFTYLVFYRLLYVSLPIGSLMRSIFNI
ncbi:MAG TPA: tripartite tricarboxylate transporter TctB family protein [Bacillota bacterium]|nr:tripartite tricarboxylate transporter TctB family protein [Bacillota bacterium]HOA15382.1 tripartite tricarboxylate transporter TctB family protein [Bacillota bacterium]HOG53776.1 tripartite tricarboxylate transporter TctB family protein [Bacillota bacterium]